MTHEVPRSKPAMAAQRRGAAVVAVAVAGLVAGCTATPDTESKARPQTPDPAISQLESAARKLASDAVTPPPATPLTSGSGQADRRAQLTLTGFRGHGPLTVGIACHGDGTLGLRVAATPVILLCGNDQTQIFQPPQDVSTANALTVIVENPTTGPAAWAVAVFGKAPV